MRARRTIAWAVWVVVALVPLARAGAPAYPSFGAFLDTMTGLGDIADPAQRTAAVDTFWTELVAAQQVPYTQGNQAALLYRGPAGSVAFAGDFNGWNPNQSPGTQVPGTDLWYRAGPLPTDARVDYKIVRDGSWILDPVNPLQQWSGFGPNSELRMPAYVFPTETVRDPSTPRGQLSGNVRLTSTVLNTDVNVRIYTPHGYTPIDELPVVYFTDGHEYLDDRLGAAVTVLDNIIAAQDLRPTIAVFIDPRDPNTNANRRTDQLGGSGKAAFADFIADELVPYVDGNYGTAESADDRVILGTSLGGLFSAFMGARHPDVIANLVIQSPAFWFDSSIYSAYQNNPTLADALRIHMHTGTINDDGGATNMAGILNANGYDYHFETISQGHSWGHWKGQIDDALIDLIGGAPIPEPSMVAVLFTLCATARGRRCRLRASTSTPQAASPNPASSRC